VVTQNSNVADIGALLRHENVIKCWRLPREYVLFEFYHPVFDHIYEINPQVKHTALGNESIRSQTAAASAIERGLLGPLYRKTQSPSDAVMLLVPAKTVFYEFLGARKGRIPWPDLGCSPGWESVRSVFITGQRESVSPEKEAALKEVFQEWLDTMKELGVMNQADSIRLVGHSFETVGEFTEPCGDAAIALYMLLTETRKITTVQSIGFFAPTDTIRRYLPIGRTRRG
jgi:hypothetical protein